MTTEMHQNATITNEYVSELPKNVIRAIRVLLALSPEERAELFKLHELVGSSSDEMRRQLREVIINVKTGPWGDGCPFCGK
jgi:hypothetical protein